MKVASSQTSQFPVLIPAPRPRKSSLNLTRGKVGHVHALEEAAVCQIRGSDDVASDGRLFVVLAPIDVGPAGLSTTRRVN